MAYSLPCSSVASSQPMTWLAAAASSSSLTRADQSQARPSLCSLRPPWSQARLMPEVSVEAKASVTISANA